MAEATRGIGQRRGNRVQAVEPDGAAWGFRRVLAVAMLTRTVAVLAVLGAILERLALRPRAAVVRLAVLAWRARTLRAGVQYLAPLGLALVLATLLAVVGLALMSRRSGLAPAAVEGRTPGAARATGMGRFHLRRV
jgi:hypothetical protein